MGRQYADYDRDTLQEGEHALFAKVESFLNRWVENHFSKSLDQALEAAMQPTVDRVHAELSKLKAQAGIVHKGTAPRVDVNVSLASLGVRIPFSIAGGVARQPPEKSIDELLNEVETERQAEELWQRSPAIRDEFPASTTLFAYCQANRRGLIHWQQKGATAGSETPDKAVLAISTRERAMELWQESPKLRAEFESAESMYAYAQALQSGRARIFRPIAPAVVK
jgi:hypothetical protein